MTPAGKDPTLSERAYYRPPIDGQATMRHSRILWATVSVSLIAISLFPIYTIFFLAPRFRQLFIEATKDEAVRLATSIATLAIAQEGDLTRESVPTALLDRLTSDKGDGRLIKIKVFSRAGEILYSTERAEVGRVNRETYFREIEATGQGRVEVIQGQLPSLENEVVPADVVETYVPIKRVGRLMGVFELYHDVSREQRDLNRLIYRSYGTLFAMAAGLLVLVVASSLRAHLSIKERAKAEEQLRLLSLTDDLTGLYNRRGFLALAQQQMRVAVRDRKPLMVISADLDGLKEINDTFGHKEGDAAIAEAADALRESFRQSDVIARIGGDEFALLLTGGEAVFDPEQLRARLSRTLGKRNARRDRRYVLSVSAGFACFDAAGDHTFEQLLHEADSMMYEQKRVKKGGAEERP